MSATKNVIEHIRQNKEKALDDLIALSSIPSISTLSQHQPDINQAAEWLLVKLRDVGLENVEIMATDGHPVVFGETSGGDNKPTILIYGHYDVQPADPIDEWHSPPFEPNLVGDNLYGRGVSDMKSQIVAVLAAIKSLTESERGFPAAIKVLLEGEEEIGSPSLAGFIQQHTELLGCDFSLNADSGIIKPSLPALVYGLRGLAYFELCVYGPSSDLHSGQFGGAVHNPAQVLCEVIAGMHQHDGSITLPGFYDTVRPLADEERIIMANVPYDEQEFLRAAANPPALHGEIGYTTIERVGARPTLEVNGLHSGFTGEGSKTVLPAKAMAKISMRLVPDQKATDVARQLRTYLTKTVPKSVRWELIELAHAPTAIVDRNTCGIRSAASALTQVFGVDPVFERAGGSVPVVGMLQEILGVDSVMMGFSLPDDGIHGPNEKQHIPTFYRGIEAYAHFFVNSWETWIP